jgi:hypothetical protein
LRQCTCNTEPGCSSRRAADPATYRPTRTSGSGSTAWPTWRPGLHCQLEAAWACRDDGAGNVLFSRPTLERGVLTWRWRPLNFMRLSIDSGGANGTRTPTLTRENAISTAVSFRLVPFQSRSLLAVSFSGLDAVKSAGSSGACRISPVLIRVALCVSRPIPGGGDTPPPGWPHRGIPLAFRRR